MGCNNLHQGCVDWGEAMIELSKILDRALVYTHGVGKLHEIGKAYAYFRDLRCNPCYYRSNCKNDNSG